MAQYFGTDRGAQFGAVSTGTATTGRKIELVVDTSGGGALTTRAEVLRALEAITNFIVSNPSPFAQ